MKTGLYDYVVKAGLTRRRLLQSAATVGGAALVGGFSAGSALAGSHSSVRADILKIPGVGAGSPADADWQKVGAMCLEATKASVAEGEFSGVELTFMGLNNQNLHNVLLNGISFYVLHLIKIYVLYISPQAFFMPPFNT